MFTGLIESHVAVRFLEPFGPGGSGARLVLEPPVLDPEQAPWEPVLGESLAISGCCLTLVEVESDGGLVFELSSETLACTWMGELAVGRRVNLERSVRPFDRLGGHMVSGHVDTVGRIEAIEAAGDAGRLFTFEVPEGFERYLVPKGSVTVDGISLTVVDPRGRHFDVAVIPETLERTTLGQAQPGQPVHLEADLIGKWVDHLLAARGTATR